MQTQVSQGVHHALALKGLTYVQQYSGDLKSGVIRNPVVLQAVFKDPKSG